MKSENSKFNNNGDGLTAAQYRGLKKRFPLVILNKNGEPDFKDRPKTRDEALNWLKNKRLVEKFERDNEIENRPKTLILCTVGQESVSPEQYLMQTFNIGEGELS